MEKKLHKNHGKNEGRSREIKCFAIEKCKKREQETQIMKKTNTKSKKKEKLKIILKTTEDHDDELRERKERRRINRKQEIIPNMSHATYFVNTINRTINTTLF